MVGSDGDLGRSEVVYLPSPRIVIEGRRVCTVGLLRTPRGRTCGAEAWVANDTSMYEKHGIMSICILSTP